VVDCCGGLACIVGWIAEGSQVDEAFVDVSALLWVVGFRL
jgi:hypothetical protein